MRMPLLVQDLGDIEENIMETDLIELKIKRTPEGISIYAKSPIIADWVKTQTAYPECEKNLGNPDMWNISNAQGWGDKLGYKLPSRNFFASMNGWGSSRLFIKEENVSGGIPNLAFLKARGLEKGLTFELHGLYSADSLNRYRDEARDQIIRIYRKYIKKVSTTLKITVIDDEV